MTDHPGVTVQHDVAMTTRDGVTLYADVYRPASDAPLPALVHRTAYGKQNAPMIAELIADPAALAAHGYAVVVQDVRGRFSSGGDSTPVVHERDDGYDTVEWVAAQPWCTGRVGAYGSSYMGITAYQAMAAAPPHLAAVATVVAGCDHNDGLGRTGGAMELGFMSFWAVSTALDAITRLDEPERTRRHDLIEAANADPWGVVRALPAASLPSEVAPWLGDWIAYEPDHEFWRDSTLTAADVHVPLLQVVGLRDWMQRSMLRLFRELPVDERSRLIAGPWTHRSAYGGDSGTRDWSRDAVGGPTGHLPRLVAWFDRWLRDRRDDAPRVQWFATGDETWRSAPTWPPAGRELRLHLAPGGRLTPEPADDGWTQWRHDPDDPVPTCGGMIAMPLFGPDGVQDRRAVEDRPDVVVWTGDELDEPLAVVGQVRVEVELTADVVDLDLVAMLVDVTPDGTAEPVTEGVQRLRYREGGHDAWLEPGVATNVTLRLADTAHTFLPGHRVRLELAASNFPRFSRNSGTTELPEHARTLRPATVRVRHDSVLVLHVA